MNQDPLRVCIDVSAAVHHRAGLGRYAHELVKGLADLPGGDRVPAVGPRGEDAAREQLPYRSRRFIINAARRTWTRRSNNYLDGPRAYPCDRGGYSRRWPIFRACRKIGC